MAGRWMVRWLAPLSSTALLAYLVVRVSGCDRPPNAATAPPSPPAAQVSAAVGDESAASPPDIAASNAATPGYFQRPNSFEYLGATKAAPMVLGESLREQAVHEPPANEPAVHQGAP